MDDLQETPRNLQESQDRRRSHIQAKPAKRTSPSSRTRTFAASSRAKKARGRSPASSTRLIQLGRLSSAITSRLSARSSISSSTSPALAGWSRSVSPRSTSSPGPLRSSRSVRRSWSSRGGGGRAAVLVRGDADPDPRRRARRRQGEPGPAPRLTLDPDAAMAGHADLPGSRRRASRSISREWRTTRRSVIRW